VTHYTKANIQIYIWIVFDLCEYICNDHRIVIHYYSEWYFCRHITHLWQQCHNSKFVKERLLKVLKCYNFLWVQWWHNCPPVASFANYVMTLYLVKVNLQTFISIPITQKCQTLSCDTLVANEQYVYFSSMVEPTRCTMSQIYFILEQHSTCFGRSFRLKHVEFCSKIK
jgi:hypothetical protein